MPWGDIAIGLIPSAGVLAVFWFVIRAVIRADRRERDAMAKLDREESQDK